MELTEELKESLRQFRRRFEEADRIIAREQFERLGRLTEEESLHEYDQLVRTWEGWGRKHLTAEEARRLDELKLAERLELRAKLDRAARKRS